MKQNPSNLKFKKYHKSGKAFLYLSHQRSFLPSFGFFGLKAMQMGKLTFNQIEAGRRAIRRTTKKDGFVWINLFTYASVTSKPVASRMGKGKGAHSHWVCPVRLGQVLYEVGGLTSDISLKALTKAATKLPIKTSVIKLIY